ncbi:MAG: PIN domain-containing protein [Candidatus Pacearchaeota archaeon]|jgi:rRNA-processing protein FCF1
MKEFILDTSFIVSCVKNKIDFFEELIGEKIIIPKQVIEELKRIKESNSELALKILKLNSFKKIDLGKGHVDKLLIKYARENPKVIVATLDREIKNKLKNYKLIIRGKKKLEIL